MRKPDRTHCSRRMTSRRPDRGVFRLRSWVQAAFSGKQRVTKRVNFPILFRQPFDRPVHERHCPKGINRLCEESDTLLDRVMSTPPAPAEGELWYTFTCDLRTKGKYRIGLILKEKPAARLFPSDTRSSTLPDGQSRIQRQNRLDRYLTVMAIILLKPLLSAAVSQEIRACSRAHIRHCAYCGVRSV